MPHPQPTPHVPSEQRVTQQVAHGLFRLFRKGKGGLLLLVLGAHLPAAVAADIRVIDGDTLQLRGETIRLSGIDAPELHQSCQDLNGRHTPCGLLAKAALDGLVGAGSVTCTGNMHDAYGRRIATCFQGTANLNQAMVRLGQARAYLRYSRQYEKDEVIARDNTTGFWRGTFEPPWRIRAENLDLPSSEGSGGCRIKGNISSQGRIYHSPGTRHYGRTRINTETGERWFCAVKEAVAAGWRPAKR